MGLQHVDASAPSAEVRTVAKWPFLGAEKEVKSASHSPAPSPSPSRFYTVTRELGKLKVS